MGRDQNYKKYEEFESLERENNVHISMKNEDFCEP